MVDALRKKVEGRERKIGRFAFERQAGLRQDADKLVARERAGQCGGQVGAGSKSFHSILSVARAGSLARTPEIEAIASWRQFARREVEAKHDVWEELWMHARLSMLMPLLESLGAAHACLSVSGTIPKTHVNAVHQVVELLHAILALPSLLASRPSQRSA